MLYDDIVKAQKILSHSDFNFGDTMFHNNSPIYKISNERIQDYHKYFVGRNKVLSVIGSGDQVLNMILEGTTKIDAFDISTFPKYFLYLKIAAIKSLYLGEYLDFFYEETNIEEVYDEMYERISIYLDKEVKEFWDSLINFFDWKEIYNSTLFSSEPCLSSNAINQNRYLQSEENYYSVRDNLSNVEITTYECNIMDGFILFSDSYDLVYLSNIIYYNSREEYREMLSKFNLTDKGISLTYLYSISPVVRDFFSSEKITFKQFDNTSSGLMIYHK